MSEGFGITFTTEQEYPYDDAKIPAAIGRIQLGNWTETFLSSLYEWDRQAYRDHWFTSLQHFVGGGRKAVLFTNYLSRDVASRIEWWELYRGDGDCVYVQNRLPAYDMLPTNFSAVNASSLLGDRETSNEDGQLLSEWRVGMRDLERFYYNFNRFADGMRMGDRP